MFPVTVAVNCCVWVVAATAARTGDTVTVTLGAAIVRLTGMVGERLPDVPVTVTVAVPGAAVPDAVNVITLVVAVLVGVNDAVTPEGKPVADKDTLPVKPFRGTTVTVLVALPPWPTLGFAGVAESVKLGGGSGSLLLPHPAKTSDAARARISLYAVLRFIPIFS